MLITEGIFSAYLKCQTKCHLKSLGMVGTNNAISEWQQCLSEEYKGKCLAALKSACLEDECFIGTLPLPQLVNKNYQLVFECAIDVGNIQVRIPMLERVYERAKKKYSPYAPLRFVPGEKITEDDKLL